MKYSLVLLVLFFSLSAAAQQVRIKDIREANPKFKDRNNVFPLIEIAADKKTAKKINDDLRLDYLRIEDPSEIKYGIFEYVNPGAEDSYNTMRDISYEVLCNKNGLLSLSLTGDACAAYCETNTCYYTYDTRSGNRVTLDTLIKPEFRRLLLDSLNDTKEWLLRRKVADINDSIKIHKPWKTAEDSVYYEDLFDLYFGCIETTTATFFDYFRFYLSKEILYIEMDRCSAHYNRGIDDLGVFPFTFRLATWKKYFTDYGAGLLK